MIKTITTPFVSYNGVIVTHPQLLEGLKCESQTENSGKARSRGTLPGLSLWRGRGVC
jgi:hypothetical protein